MGKRYYCDYCDRSFIDDIQARKKHLNGTAHIRNKKLHYLQCRDLKTLIEEESAKEECFKFKNSGSCPFGETCFRSHYPKYILQNYKEQLKKEEEWKNNRFRAELKTIESWLQKRGTGVEPYETFDSVTSTYNVPNFACEFSNYYNIIPPSLQPLNVNNLKDAEVPEWGL